MLPLKIRNCFALKGGIQSTLETVTDCELQEKVPSKTEKVQSTFVTRGLDLIFVLWRLTLPAPPPPTPPQLAGLGLISRKRAACAGEGQGFPAELQGLEAPCLLKLPPPLGPIKCPPPNTMQSLLSTGSGSWEH